MGVMHKELLAQIGLCLRVFSYHEQSAGVFVYAMHQSHLRRIGVKLLAPSLGFQRRVFMQHVPCYGIDQCAIEIACSRVHHHSSLFVYHHQHLVFIHYVERDVLRVYRGIVLGLVQHQRHHIARSHLIVALYGLIVYVYVSSLRSLLYAVA